MTVLWSDKSSADCGHSNAAWSANGISIDARTLTAGQMFVALPGSRADGHDFLSQAEQSNAACAMVLESQSLKTRLPLLRVSDCLEGLRCLASVARSRTKSTIIALTGSSGKTTTKDMLAHMVTPQAEVYATPGNLNNHIGLPLSLASMPLKTEQGIFELGMSKAGQIEDLSRLLRPDIAIITNIGMAHRANFASPMSIAEAKAEIFLGMDGGAAILWRESPFFALLRQKAQDCGVDKIISFGFHSEADWQIRSYQSSFQSMQATIVGGNRHIAVRMPSLGRHMALNSAACLAATAQAGGDPVLAAEALRTFQPTGGRGNASQLKLQNGTITLRDESYNANPASMRAALAALGECLGRRIIVLGDMLELGDEAVGRHIGLVSAIESAGIDRVFTSGPLMRHLYQALPEARRGWAATCPQDLIEPLLSYIQDRDIVMVKGSAGSSMVEVVNELWASSIRGEDSGHRGGDHDL